MLIIAYDGTDFCGYAMQKDRSIRTVEGVLNEAISSLTGEEIFITGASRTDSGVHALCNYCVFDTESRIPPDKFAAALNTRLPSDLRVRKSKEVAPDFHPRNVRSIKTYEYRIYNAGIPDPVLERYTHFTYFRMDVEKMREAAQYLVGEHDFRSFCNPATAAQSTVREITSIEVTEEEVPVPAIMLSRAHTPADQDRARKIVIRVSGKGFLYNMVRIIAGTLMDVGRGLRTPQQVKEMLEAKDRQAAGPTAAAKGLFLVDYKILG